MKPYDKNHAAELLSKSMTASLQSLHNPVQSKLCIDKSYTYICKGVPLFEKNFATIHTAC